MTMISASILQLSKLSQKLRTSVQLFLKYRTCFFLNKYLRTTRAIRINIDAHRRNHLKIMILNLPQIIAQIDSQWHIVDNGLTRTRQTMETERVEGTTPSSIRILLRLLLTKSKNQARFMLWNHSLTRLDLDFAEHPQQKTSKTIMSWNKKS